LLFKLAQKRKRTNVISSTGQDSNLRTLRKWKALERISARGLPIPAIQKFSVWLFLPSLLGKGRKMNSLFQIKLDSSL
jgi:hypothetical protein